MSRRRTSGLAALGVSAALVVAACSSSSSSSGSSTPANSVAFNTGVTTVVNPPTAKGGTVIYDNGSGPLHQCRQHLLRVQPELHQVVRDPADDVQGLHRFVSPGACPGTGDHAGGGERREQDLDVSPEVRGGVRGRDPGHLAGRQVRGGADVDRSVLPNGPSYFSSPLAGNAASYKGPFKDKTGNLTAIDTPDSSTTCST